MQQPAFVASPPPKRSNAWIVILVVAIGLVVMVPILGLLAAIAIPNFVKARHSSQRAACVANLKTIDSAKASWALENKKTAEDIPTVADLSNYMRAIGVCPANGSYTIGTVGEKPTCTISGHEL